MIIADEPLRAALQRVGVLEPAQLDAVAKRAASEHRPLADVLLDENLLTDEQLGQVTAQAAGFAFVHLRAMTIDEPLLQLIPELVAKSRLAIVYRRDAEGLHVATANPDDLELAASLQKKTGELVHFSYATPRDVADALSRYRTTDVASFADLVHKLTQQTGLKPEDASVVSLVDRLVSYADENKASDIHLEPQRDKLAVRYRIDGVLHDVVDLPKEVDALVVSRLKVLSQLRLDEHRAAQDGKFRFTTADGPIDVRVSVLPVTTGEKVVLRLLSAKNRQISLDEVGFSNDDLRKVKAAFAKPYGMILATGPTGCGKTTTLYSILRILNTREVNISTIEDPVEYELEGVNQIQVNPKTNLTFAEGLRSILRQDPDVIMVGEIRDEDTAGIAINSAMTGHLVLSTLHTNDAATALPRLLDMGIEPFLIASTVNLIIAQRLVRKICSQCLTSYTVQHSELTRDLAERLVAKHFRVSRKREVRLYRGKGCKACSGTGFRGRIGIFEVLVVTESIRTAIMARANAAEIEAKAVAEGMAGMLDDGLRKVVAGETTLEEVLRASRG